jgi:hypothetical protein
MPICEISVSKDLDSETIQKILSRSSQIIAQVTASQKHI